MAFYGYIIKLCLDWYDGSWICIKPLFARARLKYSSHDLQKGSNIYANNMDQSVNADWCRDIIAGVKKFAFPRYARVFTNHSQEHSLSFTPGFANWNVTHLLIGQTVWFSQSEVVLHSNPSKYRKI